MIFMGQTSVKTYEKKKPSGLKGWAGSPAGKPAYPYGQIGVESEIICLVSFPLLLRLLSSRYRRWDKKRKKQTHQSVAR
jgi:hypothetical protein